MAEDKVKKVHSDLTKHFDSVDFGMDIGDWSEFEEKLAEKYFENKKYQAKK